MSRILANYEDDLDGDDGYDGPTEADRGDWEDHCRRDRQLEEDAEALLRALDQEGIGTEEILEMKGDGQR